MGAEPIRTVGPQKHSILMSPLGSSWRTAWRHCVFLPRRDATPESETSRAAFTVPTVPSAYLEQSMARDAFGAALAAKLIDNQRQFSEEVALWATTAMAAAIADHPLPNPMPDRRRVEQLLERSRFNINPRGPQIEE